MWGLMVCVSELLPVIAQILQGNSDIHAELVLGHLMRGKKTLLCNTTQDPYSVPKIKTASGEGFEGEGTCVHLWLIHGDGWQKPTQHCKAVILQLKINRQQQQKPASENSYSKNERQMANSSNCLRDTVEVSFKITNMPVVKCPLNPVLCCGKWSNSDDEIINQSNNSSSCLCLSISRGEGPELSFTRAHRARASGRPLSTKGRDHRLQGSGEQTPAVSPEPQQHSPRPHSAWHHILVQKTEVRDQQVLGRDHTGPRAAEGLSPQTPDGRLRRDLLLLWFFWFSPGRPAPLQGKQPSRILTKPL